MEDSVILAIDIGGTEVKYGLIDSEQKEIKILKEASYKTNAKERKGPGIEEDLLKLIKKIQNEIKLKGVAISTAGIVSPKTGEITFANDNIPDYKGINLKNSISKLGLLALVVNDVNAAAYGEYAYGSIRNSKNALCLTVGTGVGGAIIIEGKIYEGSNGGAGEVGYMSIGENLFENLASTAALVNRVNQQKKGNNFIDGREVFRLAKQGDSICIKEINRLCYWLVKGLANLAVILQPDTIVLGGGIMEQKSYLKPIILSHIKNEFPSFFRENLIVQFASLGNKAGMIGAYSLLKNEI